MRRRSIISIFCLISASDASLAQEVDCNETKAMEKFLHSEPGTGVLFQRPGSEQGNLYGFENCRSIKFDSLVCSYNIEIVKDENSADIVGQQDEYLNGVFDSISSCIKSVQYEADDEPEHLFRSMGWTDNGLGFDLKIIGEVVAKGKKTFYEATLTVNNYGPAAEGSESIGVE